MGRHTGDDIRKMHTELSFKFFAKCGRERLKSSGGCKNDSGFMEKVFGIGCVC
jgi:hypothetical protein